MPIKPTIFEWANLTSDSTGSKKWTKDMTTAIYPITLLANREYDIFNGNYGIRINQPAQLRGNEFVVIDKIACSAHAGSHVQIIIETTKFFLSPDRKLFGAFGVPGLASPYPVGTSSTCDGSDAILPSFDLAPPIYILPGQQWSALFTTLDGVLGVDSSGNTAVAAMISYVVYDGIDAMIANKVMELGLNVTSKNVDWYKRKILKLTKEQAETVGASQDGNIPYA